MYKKYASYLVLTGFLSVMSGSVAVAVNPTTEEKRATEHHKIRDSVRKSLESKGLAQTADEVSQGMHTDKSDDTEVVLFCPHLNVVASSKHGIPEGTMNATFVKNEDGLKLGKMLRNLPEGATIAFMASGSVNGVRGLLKALVTRQLNGLILVKSLDKDERVVMLKNEKEAQKIFKGSKK